MQPSVHFRYHTWLVEGRCDARLEGLTEARRADEVGTEVVSSVRGAAQFLAHPGLLAAAARYTSSQHAARLGTECTAG